MTKEVNRNHMGHMELWDELYREPEITINNQTRLREKRDWSGWEVNGGSWAHVNHCCFACKVVSLFHLSEMRCSNCPIKWSDREDNYCGSYESPFYKWVYSTNPKDRSYYAGIIRDLKWEEKEI